VSLLSLRALAIVLVTLLAADPAARGDKRKPADAEAEAQAHYQRALSYYNLREYGIAVLEFKEAYAISNEPLLLFNIGQAYRLDRQYEEALHYYRTFLQLRPRAPNRHDVEQFVAEMERALKTEQQLRRDDSVAAPESAPESPTVLPMPPASEPPAAPPSAPPERAAPTVTTPPSSLLPTPAPSTTTTTTATAAKKKPLRKRWWIWTVAGVGVAAAGAGLAIGLTLGRHEVLPAGSLGSIDARH
jgi:tetratricopeptide (TPR) repeat protein